MNDVTRTVAEYLLSQEARISDIAKVLKRDPRTVYRAVEALKRLPEYRVMRWGTHGDYVYKLEQL